MVDEEIPPYYVKRLESPEKRYINVTNYYCYFIYACVYIYIYNICGGFSVNINLILSNDYLIVFIFFQLNCTVKKNCVALHFSV